MKPSISLRRVLVPGGWGVCWFAGMGTSRKLRAHLLAPTSPWPPEREVIAAITALKHSSRGTLPTGAFFWTCPTEAYDATVHARAAFRALQSSSPTGSPRGLALLEFRRFTRLSALPNKSPPHWANQAIKHGWKPPTDRPLPWERDIPSPASLKPIV